MSKILRQFLTRSNFQQAWQQVAKNKGCAGVDGETIAHFTRREREYLEQLRRAIAQGTYRPLPLRQIFIPKKEGGWRELRVPTVRDRIVQQALLQVLHPVMEREFEDASFAYRPGRGHLMAVRQVTQWHNRDYDWVLEADIRQYFDNILHPRLLAEIIERLDEPWVLALIESWVKVGVLTKEGLLLGVAQ